jgi:hypothetical protein
MAWNRSIPERLKLASGNEPLVKKVDPAGLIMHNMGTDSVPAYLKAQMIKQFNNPNQVPEPLAIELTEDNISEYAKFIDMIVSAAMVEPRIVAENPNYDQNEILLSDMTQAERTEVFRWAMPSMEMAAASTFPAQPVPGVEPALPGESLPAVTG